MTVAACKPTDAAPSAAPRNILTNGDFARWTGDVPTGWTFEDRVKHKGRLSRGQGAGASQSCATLSPNEHNPKGVHPLAIGQGFPIDPYAGKSMTLSGRIGAKGGATAVLGVSAVRADGHIVSQAELRASDQGSTGALQQTTFQVPDQGDAIVLVVRCYAEGPTGNAYFDDVSFGVATGQDRSGSAAASAGKPLHASIRVNASKTIRRIPRTLYGTNIEWIYDGYGIWDAQTDQLQPKIVRLTRELDVSLIRFPGGVFSDFYHWRDGVGPISRRATTPHVPGSAKSPHRFGTDEALNFAQQVGGQLLITVNAVTGTPEEAADWVRFVNKGADPKHQNRVHDWEIGNESYSKHDSPTARAATMSPTQYAEKVIAFAKAMHAVDPTIKIGAIGNENYGRYRMNSYPGWNETVLSHAAEYIDFFAVHNAYYPMPTGQRHPDVRALYEALLAAPINIKKNLRTVSDQIDRFAPNRADRIKLAVTEWGPLFHADPADPLVDHVKTLGSALYVASVMHAFLKTPKMEVANFFKLVDNAFMGWIGLRDGHYVPKAPYLALQMYTRHFGDVLVETETDGPTYSCDAVGLIDRVEGVPYLDTVASLSEDGDTLFIMVINKNLDVSVTADVALNGFRPDHNARVRTMTGQSIDANTGTELPKIPGLNWAKQLTAGKNGRFHRGAPDEITIDTRTAQIAGPSFEISFPPRSITSIEIPAAGDTDGSD